MDEPKREYITDAQLIEILGLDPDHDIPGILASESIQVCAGDWVKVKEGWTFAPDPEWEDG
jgi:hypothetical protein